MTFPPTQSVNQTVVQLSNQSKTPKGQKRIQQEFKITSKKINANASGAVDKNSISSLFESSDKKNIIESVPKSNMLSKAQMHS